MLTTGEAIGVLRAIEWKVVGHDIPSPGNCPEYREHHEACLDILKYIRSYINMIKQYDGIPSIQDMYPSIQDMYPSIHGILIEDKDPVPMDPNEYLKREV